MKPIFAWSVLLLVLFISCNKNKDTKTPDPGFTKYVEAYTSGYISVESPIVVCLNNPVKGGKLPNKKLFKFSPEIKGDAVLTGERNIEFRPSSPLKPGTKYNVEFALGEVASTESKFRKMPFSFSTIEQSLSVTFEGLKVYDNAVTRNMKLTGYVITADVADNLALEKIINGKFDGNPVAVSWTHSENRLTHNFTVDSLLRDETKTQLLTVDWDGKNIGVNKSGSEKFEIPSLNDFKVLEAKVVHEPSQHVQIIFSDPVSRKKDLNGLVSLAEGKELRLVIDGNMIKAWPSEELTGELQLHINSGIESMFNKKLKNDETFLLQFTGLKPAIKLIGKGVIVPQGKTLEIPFEAVNIKAVELRIMQIYKNNILLFFQSNHFDESNELRRVGRLVYSGKLDLAKQVADFAKWNTYKVNLADLITIEQGCIYRVEFRIKKEYSVYDCEDKEENTGLSDAEITNEESYTDEQDYPDWYSDYYYDEGYKWDERDNPCDVSYYNSSRFVVRNVFSSELGIVAKEGKSHEMVFAVSNLITTAPESGVKLKLYNLQNQLITETETNSDGFARVDLRKKPFFLVAQKNNQFGYLRLDDGSSLSLSNFDINGEEITDGIKGFIYGERGVWRPGDSIYINFVLEKQSQGLPENFPVSLQLYNPQEQVVIKQVKNENENGFYSFIVKTQSNAPTGNWRAEIKAGNAFFTKRIKIEAIKPNRLKVELELPQTLLTPETSSVKLSSSWLHGAPASLLKTKVDVLFVSDHTEFKGFEKYSFNDPASSFTPQEQTIFEGTLDEKGKTNVPLDFELVENAPGMLKAWFTTRVFEEGGDFSINVDQAKFAPYKRFVGVKMPESEDGWYKTDMDYLPEIVLVDSNGNPSSGGELEAKLYKVDWRWWWESGQEYLAHYVSGNYYKPLLTWNIPSARHKNQIQLHVKYRNWEDNGRYLLRVSDKNSGHSTGITFYMSKWGGWRSEGMSENATLLSLKTDKAKYVVGDKIEVTIPSSKSGRALVSIENGTTVKNIFWVKTDDKQTKFTIKATPDLAPNCYVHVSLIQPYGQTENDAPIRLYGVVPLLVENPETILKPKISTAAEFEPEKKFTVQVSEENRKDMTYTLAIVDEGLLGLTNFKTPNPYTAFYAREALGVKTWDLYDYVAGAYGAKLEKAFAVGGDDDLKASSKKEINRFKPVVLYAGPFTLKGGKTNKHEFTMPNYVGAVRVMVVAGNNRAYGNAEKTVPVRTGLMVLATLPRILTPDGDIMLPVNVFAMKDNVRSAEISLKTNGLVSVVGESTQRVNFEGVGDKIVWFRVKVNGKTGVAKINIQADSGSENARYEVELEVKNPNQKIVVEKSGFVEAGANWKADLNVPGEPAMGDAWVEISGFPPMNLTKHLEYLIEYPHGCVEQTVSSAFAQLYIDKLLEVSAEQKSEMEQNVRTALQKLQSLQLPNGGFGYWPGASVVNEWGTNYAGHFMVSAEGAGYSLPVGMKKKWIDFQRSASRNWAPVKNQDGSYFVRNNDFTQSYRLYTLALAGSPDMGAMNRLREKPGKSSEVTWNLAAAYSLAGQNEAANQLISNLSSDVPAYNEFGGTFGSDLRDKAMILETLILLDKRENAFKLLQQIADRLNKTNWVSTQEASWSLLAAAKYASKYFKNAETSFTLTLNKDKTSLRTEVPVVKIKAKNINGPVKADFKNTGGNPLFVRLLATGIPSGVDSTSAQKNLVITVKYTNAEGADINPLDLKQGTDFRMVVTIKHPGQLSEYENLVLTCPVPPGWEIINKRLHDIPQNNAVYYDYQDIRDDRVYTYFDLKPALQKTFILDLNATYQGNYYQPPVRCEAMYDGAVYAQVPGRIVKVSAK